MKPVENAYDEPARDGGWNSVMLSSMQSERRGRVIDYDEAGSMKKKKREGYF